ncbi:hypothetical protein ACOJCD_003166 [Cronobacter dublinensis]
MALQRPKADYCAGRDRLSDQDGNENGFYLQRNIAAQRQYLLFICSGAKKTEASPGGEDF